MFFFIIIHSAMVYHPNEFETAVTLGQNEPLYCNVPDSLPESLARVRLGGPSDFLLSQKLDGIRGNGPLKGK